MLHLSFSAARRSGAMYACKSISKAKLVSEEDVADVKREVGAAGRVLLAGVGEAEPQRTWQMRRGKRVVAAGAAHRWRLCGRCVWPSSCTRPEPFDSPPGLCQVEILNLVSPHATVAGLKAVYEDRAAGGCWLGRGRSCGAAVGGSKGRQRG